MPEVTDTVLPAGAPTRLMGAEAIWVLEGVVTVRSGATTYRAGVDASLVLPDGCTIEGPARVLGLRIPAVG